MKNRIFCCLLVTAAMVIVGLGQNAASKPASANDYAELSNVPAKARSQNNPLAANSKAPLAGNKLFQRHCAECHGSDAAGGRKGPSLRAPEVRQASDGSLFWVLSNGVVRRGMPDWSKLPEAQRWQLVSYLKSLAANEVPAAPAKDAPK